MSHKALQKFQEQSLATIEMIGDLLTKKEEIEATVKTMREELLEAMERYEIKKVENDLIRITYIEPSTRTSIDSTKLRMQMPDIAEKFSKTSAVKAFVKIELKK